VAGEPGAQLVGAGQDQCPGLAGRPGALPGGAALGDHQRADRLDSAVAALRRAAGPAGLGGPGGADRVQGVRLALPPPVLAVRAIHFHDPDAGRGDVAGQAGAVAAGALDPDQAHGPEPAQPGQQAGVAGRGDRELPDAEQAADGIERRGDMDVRVGARAAGDGACLYDRQCHPFSQVEGVDAPAGRRAREPRPLAQDGQIRPARRWVPGTWDPADRSSRRTARSGVSRFGGQAGTQCPDTTPVPGQTPGSRAGARSTYPHPPCRFRALV
jgi:hypothetical protein